MGDELIPRTWIGTPGSAHWTGSGFLFATVLGVTVQVAIGALL